MISLILIEPQAVYEKRVGIAQAVPSTVSVPRPSTAPPVTRREPYRRSLDDFWTTSVFDELRAYGEPLRITSVVTIVSRFGRYSNRAARDSRRIALFRLVGGLIKEGRLIRVDRNFVTLPPPVKE